MFCKNTCCALFKYYIFDIDTMNVRDGFDNIVYGVKYEMKAHKDLEREHDIHDRKV